MLRYFWHPQMWSSSLWLCFMVRTSATEVHWWKLWPSYPCQQFGYCSGLGCLTIECHGSVTPRIWTPNKGSTHFYTLPKPGRAPLPFPPTATNVNKRRLGKNRSLTLFRLPFLRPAFVDAATVAYSILCTATPLGMPHRSPRVPVAKVLTNFTTPPAACNLNAILGAWACNLSRPKILEIS